MIRIHFLKLRDATRWSDLVYDNGASLNTDACLSSLYCTPENQTHPGPLERGERVSMTCLSHQKSCLIRQSWTDLITGTSQVSYLCIYMWLPILYEGFLSLISEPTQPECQIDWQLTYFLVHSKCLQLLSETVMMASLEQGDTREVSWLEKLYRT